MCIPRCRCRCLLLQSRPLAQLLQQCAGPDAAADLQLNVVAALGQLARDQQAAAEALMEPQGEGGCCCPPSLYRLVISSHGVCETPCRELSVCLVTYPTNTPVGLL